MQLTIKANNEKGIEEWFMIELQGDLETTGDETTLQGSHMGYLLFTKKEEPILIIGHHVLYGSTAKLSKPMAVLVKKSNSSTIVDRKSGTGFYLAEPIIGMTPLTSRTAVDRKNDKRYQKCRLTEYGISKMADEHL
uniref:Chromosome transmission fidelity protein 8 homolog n=1 Tax=Romanomermis culicivorax TaxID=13658 RepID=A0A915KIP7_ROMCU